MKKRLEAFILAICVVASCLVGCTDTKQSNSDAPLKYWIRLPSTLPSDIKNYGETVYAKELYKQTGIAVEYIHPARGREDEALNLLIASGDLPDIVATDWLSRNPDVMIEKSVICSLNQYIEDYSPNLKKYLAENPDIDKQVKTDSGQYYCYPFIRSDEKLCSTSGFMVRSDWLNEMNLEIPTTISEWHNMLTQFKKKGDMPLAISFSHIYYFAGAYNTMNDFYLDEGTVKYGPIEDSFRDFLTEMNRWYNEGLLSINSAVIDDSIIIKNIRNGESGAVFGAGGSQMSRYLNMMKNTDTEFDLVAVPFPTLNKGDIPQFGSRSMKYSSIACAAISTSSENAPLAARLLDYSYSEDGHMLENFGVEGISYINKDGYPEYTKLITNDSEGLTMAQMLPLYVRASSEGSFIQDVRYIEQYYAYPQLKNALEVWGNNNYIAHGIPQISMTLEETSEYNAIMSEINAYVDKSLTEFIMGERGLDEFETFRETVKSMGIERAVEIKQAAVIRFNQR